MLNKISLIVGLSNPDKIYKHTRHNIGSWYIDELCKNFNVSLKKEKKFLGKYGLILIKKKKIYFLKPMNYINLNGESIIKVSKYYNIPIDEILVVHDDLYLVPGRAKFKKNSTHSSHNGVKNVIYNLKKNTFWSLKIGIGYPKKEKVSNFVLKNPNKKDKKLIIATIKRAVYCTKIWIEEENHLKAIQELHSFQDI